MDKSYFMNRRTIRNYSSQEVPQQLLVSLIEKASHAPTTGNMQLYSVVITRDPEMKKLIAPAHFCQPQVTGCSVLLTFCADFNRFVKWCEVRDAVPGYDNLQSLVTAVLDTVIFAQQFNTIAELNGLGCCYLGTTTYNAPDIARILRLPHRVVPVVTLSVGYPADQGREDGRLPVEAVIHNEHYHDYSSEDIDRLYSEKEAREDTARYIKENNKRTLAQVFTDVRYTKDANETFSKVLENFIADYYPGIK